MSKRLIAILLLSSSARAQGPGSTTQSPGRWILETTGSRADSSFGALLHVSASSGIESSVSHTRPELVIRCQRGNLAVYMMPGTRAQPEPDVPANRRSIRLLFDDQRAFSELWLQGENAQALFSMEPSRMIDRMLVSHRLQFEFIPLNEKPVTIDFDIAGLLTASAPVVLACPSRWREVLAGLESVAQPPERQGDSERVYFEFQTDEQAHEAPGSPVPAYPPMLRSAGVEGEVLAQFVVDTAGRTEPGTFKVLKSTHELFTQAVRDVLPNLRFTPAVVNGQKVRQLVQMPFPFQLKR
jgi:TonB family protein